ncbi:MAG: inositol monophosphatase family protein [Microthrixaceae bacterium]
MIGEHQRPPNFDTEHLAQLALRAALAGAEVAGPAQDGVRTHPERRATKSSATDLVTEADRATEAAIARVITEARPGDGFLGEEGIGDTAARSPADEGHDRSGGDGIVWVVDPIDGTTNYVYGSSEWAVCVAATSGGETLAGAVVAPALGLTYLAAAGGGATCNGEPLRLSEPPPLGRALVATGFGYDSGRRHRQGVVAAEVLPQVRDLRRRGAAALDVCAVAAGTVDAFYEAGVQWWDFAAAAVVASEAGATVVARPLDRTPADGSEGFFVLVGAPSLVGELGPLLDRLGAPAG